MLAILLLLAAPAQARPGETLTRAELGAAANRAVRATFWMRKDHVLAEKWEPARGYAWTLGQADNARAFLASGRRVTRMQPFGKGKTGGVTYFYTDGLAVTYIGSFDKRTGLYSIVRAVLAAPAGVQLSHLEGNRSLKMVRWGTW
jgi:hypothetical protein